MNADGQAILAHLNRVATERQRRRLDAPLAAHVDAVKRYQHARFASTYTDLLAQPRYARAARFFLEELYGPGDFTLRDDQFARIVPALVTLFPHDIVVTVRSLAELHALSEQLDTLMGASLGALRADGSSGADAGQREADTLDLTTYQQMWRAVGRPADREQQIVLMLAVGSALDRFTRNPLLRHSLRLMRGPARAAGLQALQTFLESGFDTFREMRGATEFLHTIATRERALAAALFAGTAGSGTGPPGQA